MRLWVWTKKRAPLLMMVALAVFIFFARTREVNQKTEALANATSESARLKLEIVRLKTISMFPDSAMTVVVGQTYTNQVVDLDGKHFVNCLFDNVTLRFNGQAPFEMAMPRLVAFPKNILPIFSGKPVIMTIDIWITINRTNPTIPKK